MIYHTIKQYRAITGDSHTVTYEKIARGELLAVKNGGKTLITNTAEHIASWPKANITMPSSSRPAKEKAPAPIPAPRQRARLDIEAAE